MAAEARVDHRHAQHAPARPERRRDIPIMHNAVAQIPIAIPPPPPRPRPAVANPAVQRPIIPAVPVYPRQPTPGAVSPQPAVVARAVAPSTQRSSMASAPTPEQISRNISSAPSLSRNQPAGLSETSSWRTWATLLRPVETYNSHPSSPDLLPRITGKTKLSKDTTFPRDTASAERKKLVKEAMNYLRVHHDCDHEHWKYRHGGGQCETCHQRLPLFLFVRPFLCDHRR